MKTDECFSELATKAELADMFRVTPRTIETWVEQGKIPAIRISARCIRFERAAVLRFIREKFATAN